ncbi:MAG TPA: non-homologous end-joining DNA ligase [Solirubrobacterales bacterium]
MASGRKLSEYEGKRDFGTTPEPSPRPRRKEKGALRFVVQEHSARRLHWDLRLEHDGVAASWAIPNGIPDDPGQNRKAVHTEDHPLEYMEFEGEIPAGEYGAGSVKIWDRGTYECHKWEPGKVVFSLAGERLSGRYALFHAGKSTQDWMIHRIDPPVEARDPFPEAVVPMLARLAPLPVRDEGWAVEVKWDGVRAIAYCRPGRIELQSRNLNDITAQYPEVRRLSRQLGAREAVLDGELVAFDEHGRPSFERLQQRIHQTEETVVRRRMKSHPVTYAIFDLLYFEGRDLTGEPYRRRRELLEGLELSGPSWQTPGYATGHTRELLEASREQQLEGIVVKRLDSRYSPGKRTGAWLKVKNTGRQEFVIGGWLPGEGRRRNRIGSILLGTFEPDGDGRALRYAGKVGTGFSERDLASLGARLAPLERRSNPFAGRKGPKKGARYVEPELVAEIEFRELTAEGMVRHGSFKGLRDDKAAAEVGLERAATPVGAEPASPDWYARIADVLAPHLHDRESKLVKTELRIALAPTTDPDRPTALVLDLVAGARAELVACAQVAVWLEGMLEQLGLSSYAKTSARGLQVWVPLNSEATHEESAAFARAIAETLAQRFPERVVSRTTASGRRGKVFVDWRVNDPTATAVCVYSLLATRPPMVSTPLEWEEVGAALAAEEADRLAFDQADVLARIERKGDLFAPLLSERQDLPRGFGA